MLQKSVEIHLWDWNLADLAQSGRGVSWPCWDLRLDEHSWGWKRCCSVFSLLVFASFRNGEFTGWCVLLHLNWLSLLSSPSAFWFWIGQLLCSFLGRHGSHPVEAFHRRAWEGDLSHLEKIQEVEERSRSWENTACSVPARSSNWSLSIEDSRSHQQVWWPGQVVKINHVMFLFIASFQ